MDSTPKSVVLFDGVCNLCKGSVQFLIKHDKHKKLSFASLQSEFGQALLLRNKLNPTEFDSFLMLKDGIIYQKSTAALLIFRLLGFPFNLLLVFWVIPKFLRDIAYQFVAKNRYKWFGKQGECWLPTAELQSRFLK